MPKKLPRNISRKMYENRSSGLSPAKLRLPAVAWATLAQSSAEEKERRWRSTKRCAPRGFTPCKVPLKWDTRSPLLWASKIKVKKRGNRRASRKREKVRSSLLNTNPSLIGDFEWQ